MIDIQKLIEQANELSPLPASTVRLARMVSSPESDLNEVAELIEFDQGLTVKLLRAANSAANASATRISNVKEAVGRLGTAQVMAHAMAASTRPFLQSRIHNYGPGEPNLWRHSVAAAVAAEVAPHFCKVPAPPETLTTALLHDIGKLVMSRFLNPEILGFIKSAQEVDHLGEREAESLLLSVDHAELGGLIAQHWELPERIVQGITHHHNPEESEDVICAFTYMANQIAKRIEAGLDGRRLNLVIPDDILEQVGLTKSSLDNYCPIAASRFEQLRKRYDAV